MEILKKISACLLIIFILISINNVSSATSMREISEQAGNILSIGKDQFDNKGIEVENITGTLLPLAQILTTIGVGIVLIVGVVMGIKYVTAGPDEQAKLKQQLVGLAVAAVVILGAYTIWSMAIDIASKIQ